MVESDKIGRKIHNLELPWTSIKILVTDDKLPDTAKRQIEQQGVRVICAPVSTEHTTSE
jgi:DeoR/GlpR family transcriptional regulator of sugar metabolism